MKLALCESRSLYRSAKSWTSAHYDLKYQHLTSVLVVQKEYSHSLFIHNHQLRSRRVRLEDSAHISLLTDDDFACEFIAVSPMLGPKRQVKATRCPSCKLISANSPESKSTKGQAVALVTLYWISFPTSRD
jgi:hypothetical protein